MASGDARPMPLKNTAYRVYFPLLDSDGDLVTGATGLDSEISKDGGTFADCTNEATEIATSSGMYYIELTSTEMNADAVCIIIKSGTAKTTPIVLYPAEATDIPANVTAWNGTAVASPATAGYPAVTIKSGTGTGEVSLSGGKTLLQDGAITAAVIATGAIDADALAADAIDEIWDEVLEGSLTGRQIVRIMLAALAGKSSGGGSSTIKFRDAGDTKDRIAATVDGNRNRTAVTVDGS